MRRLVKLVAAAAIAAAVLALLRRLLVTDAPGIDTGSSAARPRSVGSNEGGPTRQELYREAQEIGIEGRSKMNKQQLEEAVEAAKTAKTGGSS